MGDENPRESPPTSPGPAPALVSGGDLPQGYIVGEYRIDAVIGRGGMGVVYSGLQPVIEKRVAIKVLNAQFSADPGLVRRFVDEARAVNRIRHANIIDIFSFGQLADGRQYFVMEYLEGTTLAARLESGQLSLDEAPVLLAQICDALDAAHGENIVHRDLKPENVWIVTPRRGRPFVKLLDFGIAKLVASADRSTTQTGVVMGTPHYMSPEQCHGRAVDHRTDIYAMGVILYRLYAGRLPFDGETFTEVLAKQITSMPDPPSTHAQVPQALDRLIMRCLSKDPAQRPQSARELGAELTAIFSGVTAPLASVVPMRPSSTTLTASAAEVRPEGLPRAASGRRWIWAGLAVGLMVVVLLVATRLAGRSRSAAGRPASPAISAPITGAPRPAVPPAAPAQAPAPAVPPVPAAEASTAAAAAEAAKHRHTGSTGKAGKRTETPGKTGRSRASDTGLVTDNPFE